MTDVGALKRFGQLIIFLKGKYEVISAGLPATNKWEVIEVCKKPARVVLSGHSELAYPTFPHHTADFIKNNGIIDCWRY